MLNIKSSEIKSAIVFKMLPLGETFRITESEQLYMKMEPLQHGHITYNVISIYGNEKGRTFVFLGEQEVIPIEIDATVKEL